MALRRQPALDLALLLAVALTACGGAPPPEQGLVMIVPTAAPDAAPAKDAKAAPPKDSPGLTDDQKAQMEIALRRGGEKAANCATVVPDSPRGSGEVQVTFDGKKGRVTEVAVGEPFAGTPVESCIKRAFVGEYALPLDSDLEVPYTVKLPPRLDEDAKGKGKHPKAKDKK